MSQSNKKLANSELALERVKTIVKKHPISFDHH